MNKKKLIELIKKDSELTEQESTRLVTEILDCITTTLAKGEKVDLRGFGILSVTNRAERKGRNINTGEIVKIPARRTVTFRASTTLKEKIKTSFQDLNSKNKTEN